MAEEPRISSYELTFNVLPPELAPEMPEARGNKESPLRSALKEMPRGGFIFVKGREEPIRKRLSDMCSRICKLSRKKKAFSIRLHVVDGEEGIGVWRTDTGEIDPRLAKPVVNVKEIPWPTKDKLMSGK